MHRAQRAKLPVLVPEASAIGMVGVIRSLGRAGYPVHACASRPDAMGLSSKFAARGECHPPYEDPEFLPWLENYVAVHDIRCVVPSEGFLLGIRSVFERYASLLPVTPDPELVYGSLSKSIVTARLLETPECAANLPPTLVVEQGRPLPTGDELAALGLPIFVKGDGADDREGNANIVVEEGSVNDALIRMEVLRKRYRRLIVQGFVPGKGTGAYFLVHEGRIVQEFMNRCLHEVPHTGGFCSLRDSWWHEPMMEDARRKIAHLGWEGVAMLEYRWDPATDRFWFIEINARFWAALHVALYSGVDFPRMLLDLFHGFPVKSVAEFPIGIKVRYTVPFEIGYVVSRWRDKSIPFSSRLGSVLGWFGRFFDPRIRSDLYFPGDRSLYLREWRRFLKGFIKRADG